MAPRDRTLAPYLAVESATLLSGMGNGITLVALPWLVLERTGSATAAGVMAAAAAAPTMIAALASGTLVDMLGRRTISVASDLISLVAVALIPILDRLVGLDLGLIIALAIFGAVFDPVGMGAREAMLPESAGAARISLERANGIHEAVWGTAFLLGPGLGGLAIGLFGPAPTFWGTAVMFGLSAVVIAAVRIPGGSRPDADERPPGFWVGTREGLGFIWRDRPLRTMAVLIMAVLVLYLPAEGVLLPVHFQAQGQPAALGMVIMAMSGGGIVGALLLGTLARRFSRRQILLGSLLMTSLLFVPFAMLPPIAMMIPIAALVGVAVGPLDPVMNVVMQLRTPARLRGRVIGVLTATAYAAGPFGFLAVGPLVDGVGVEFAMLLVAGGLVLVALAAFLLPGLRHLEGAGGGIVLPAVDEAPPPRPSL